MSTVWLQIFVKQYFRGFCEFHTNYVIGVKLVYVCIKFLDEYSEDDEELVLMKSLHMPLQLVNWS